MKFLWTQFIPLDNLRRSLIHNTVKFVNIFLICVSSIYMIDLDQCHDSNRRSLLKSASIDVIISNHGSI